MTDELPRSPTSVAATYETIADEFDRTRRGPWPAVSRFVRATRGASVGLDLGCGNGRHIPGLLAACDAVVGVDLSRSLLEHARRHVDCDRFGAVEGAAPAIPLRSDAIDVAVYIATIHHLPDRSTRVASLDALARVLKPGGTALISGWSIHHDRFEYEQATDVTVDWTLDGGETVPRYYHLYDEDDFAAELAASDLTVSRRWLEAGNCYATVSAPAE